MSNLQQRIITAVVLVIVLLGTLFLLPPLFAVGLLSLFLLVAVWEWSGFCTQTNLPARLGYVVVAVAAAYALASVADVQAAANTVLVLGVVQWGAVLMLLFFGSRPFTPLMTGTAGYLALLPAWYAVTLILSREVGAELFLWCVAIVAAADIGAYFTGKSFGRSKLAPAISPGKTREGLLGGLLAAALVSAGVAAVLDRSPVLFSIMGLAVGAFSVVGDLWVSRFKRAAGLKDSGTVLPGHGGVMDRIDGLVAALPLFTLVALRTGIIAA